MGNGNLSVFPPLCYPAAGCHSSAADLPVPGNPAGLPYCRHSMDAGTSGMRIKAYRQCGSVMEQTDVKHSVAAES